MKFNVNGRACQFSGNPDKPLLWVIREDIGLTGTKYGCGIGMCGACTVHVDGEARRSCVTPVSAVASMNVTTIEGLSKDASHPIQSAWIQHDVPQCGYCQSGMIMAAAALLRAQPSLTDEQIDAGMTNLCRCTTYHRIRAAIRSASEAVRKD